jgi:hypothetical protein
MPEVDILSIWTRTGSQKCGKLAPTTGAKETNLTILQMMQLSVSRVSSSSFHWWTQLCLLKHRFPFSGRTGWMWSATTLHTNAMERGGVREFWTAHSRHSLWIGEGSKNPDFDVYIQILIKKACPPPNSGWDQGKTPFISGCPVCIRSAYTFSVIIWIHLVGIFFEGRFRTLGSLRWNPGTGVAKHLRGQFLQYYVLACWASGNMLDLQS